MGDSRSTGWLAGGTSDDPWRAVRLLRVAIETGMMLRLAFHLALRQTEGLMASIFDLLGVPLSTPDHSTLSRRARKMESISKILSCEVKHFWRRGIWIFKAWRVYPSDVCWGRARIVPARPLVHRQDEPTRLSLGMVASQQSPLPFHLDEAIVALMRSATAGRACFRRRAFGF